MEEDRTVLCAASFYDQNYYLNPDFRGLPQAIQDELKIMCVLFTEDVGGILKLLFDEDGYLLLETEFDEEDILYDEIGSRLKIREIQRNRQDLLESLELYYKVFIRGEDPEALLD